MADSTDLKNIRECLNGNSSAFEPLVEKYQKPLFNSALRMVGDYEDARDITQTVFIKVYENLNHYDRKYKFFSWIYRIMVNEALNCIKQRRPNDDLDENQVSAVRNPEEIMEGKELNEKVQDALSGLEIDQMVVVVLRHFADLSYKEMAYCLDISDKTVKSRLHTARKSLCNVLVARGISGNG